MSSFENKVVLVTGGSSGIGAATAILFAENGANVAIVDRNEENLPKIVNYFTKNGLPEPLVIKGDISNDGEATDAVNETVKTFGKLDVLVNNAGLVRFGSILDGNIMETYDQIMPVNVRAHILITSLAVPHLIKTKGSVINISSIASQSVPFDPTYIAYFISKSALSQFSRAAAKELAFHGVRVNCICPGPVKTDIMKNANSSMTMEAVRTPMGRISEPREIAELILFLTSDKALAITGAEYVIDNGLLLGN